MEIFGLKEMIAIIEGKRNAYTSILNEAYKKGENLSDKYLKRIDAKRSLCEELIKEYEARK